MVDKSKIPLIPKYDKTPLPSTESDKKNFKRFQERNFKKMSPKQKKQLDSLLNQFDEDEIKSNYEKFNKLKNELKDIDSKIQIVEAKEKAALHHFKESDILRSKNGIYMGLSHINDNSNR